MNLPKRIVFTAPGEAEIQSYTPPQPAPGQLLIQTETSLISPGTERAFFLGLPNTSRSYPLPTGYSNVGTVVAIGPARADAIGADSPPQTWAIGDRVANPGNHAALVAVDQRNCVPVPAGLSTEDAVFYHLLTIALQGIRRARIEVGEPVAILGAGLIGLLAAQCARVNGAAPVITIEPEAKRHPYARQSGADVTIGTLGVELNQRLTEETGPAGPPVVIEATGHPDAVVTAMELVAPGGRVVLLGSTRGETEQVNFYREVHRKGISVIGAHNIARPRYESQPGCWTQADDNQAVMRLLARGRLQVAHLITHRFAWAQALDAYALLKAWDANALGILLDWTTDRAA
ncbi:MAG: zinc-binding alcohol dehydrogenase [Litorilinea sp.]